MAFRRAARAASFRCAPGSTWHRDCAHTMHVSPRVMCTCSGEALALLMALRRPPTLREKPAARAGGSGNAAADAGAFLQPLEDLAKASRLLCRPACLPPPGCDSTDVARVAAAVSSTGLPSLPGEFAGGSRWPVSVYQQELGPLAVQQMECLHPLPLPLWMDAVSGACLQDIRPAHTGAPVQLAWPVDSHKLHVMAGADGRGGVVGEAARSGLTCGHKRGAAWLKTIAAPAAALQRLWRECHDVLVQKAVAAAKLNGTLCSRGASQERVGGLGTPPGDAGAAKHMHEAGQEAAETSTVPGDGGEKVMGGPPAVRRLHSTLGRATVAGPTYTGTVSRASPATIRRHAAASAAAFKEEIASHIAAGARPRPGLLLRDVLQGNRGASVAL